jgi:hypothetical protein
MDYLSWNPIFIMYSYRVFIKRGQNKIDPADAMHYNIKSAIFVWNGAFYFSIYNGYLVKIKLFLLISIIILIAVIIKSF